MKWVAIIGIILISPRVARGDDQVSAIMDAARTYWLRMVCETKLVSRMDAAFKRRRDVLAQGASGQLSPERWKAEKQALGAELNAIWRSEALNSNDYVKAKLVAAALLKAGRASEVSFAEEIQKEATRTCPDQAKDRDAVLSAAMGIVPVLANDPGQQPTRAETKQRPER